MRGKEWFEYRLDYTDQDKQLNNIIKHGMGTPQQIEALEAFKERRVYKINAFLELLQEWFKVRIPTGNILNHNFAQKLILGNLNVKTYVQNMPKPFNCQINKVMDISSLNNHNLS